VSRAAVSGSFDDLRSRDVRFLDEASRLGDLHVCLWSDDTVRSLEGHEPQFPEAERLYLVESLRYVRRVTPVTGTFGKDKLPLSEGDLPDVWVVTAESDSDRKRSFCASRGIEYRVLGAEDLAGFPERAHRGCGAAWRRDEDRRPETSRKKVVATGCFDWFHSGHVRFFEEVCKLGELYVVVGHDANIRLLKGEGHPLYPQEERRYMVQAIRYVEQALVSSGWGWLDAAPEIATIRPDIYAVNEDGDVPEKREFCGRHGIDYVVLRRTPKAGLPRRQSTTLRGF
jgi:cytidyltransferase-like protein